MQSIIRSGSLTKLTDVKEKPWHRLVAMDVAAVAALKARPQKKHQRVNKANKKRSSLTWSDHLFFFFLVQTFTL